MMWNCTGFLALWDGVRGSETALSSVWRLLKASPSRSGLIYLALSIFGKVALSESLITSEAEVKLLWLTAVKASHPHSCFVVSPVLDFSDPFSTEVKPRILLMGLRRSGKSSIQKVVFHKMSPNETLFLESTNKICREDVSNSSFVNFQIWDFPGQIDFFDPTFDYEMIFRGTGALIFVIDSQVKLSLGYHGTVGPSPHICSLLLHPSN